MPDAHSHHQGILAITFTPLEGGHGGGNGLLQNAENAMSKAIIQARGLMCLTWTRSRSELSESFPAQRARGADEWRAGAGLGKVFGARG